MNRREFIKKAGFAVGALLLPITFFKGKERVVASESPSLRVAIEDYFTDNNAWYLQENDHLPVRTYGVWPSKHHSPRVTVDTKDWTALVGRAG